MAVKVDTTPGLESPQGRHYLAQALREFAMSLESPLFHYNSGGMVVSYNQQVEEFRLVGDLVLSRVPPKPPTDVIDVDFTEIQTSALAHQR